MNRFPVPAGVLAACLAVLTPSALAAPDLSGKSATYVSAYRSAYVACLEKSAGEVAECEAEATRVAEATEARLSLVTAPTDPLAASTPTGKILTSPTIGSLPTDGVREVQDDYQRYAEYDYVIRLPVKIQNFRAVYPRTLEESLPVRIRCIALPTDGGGSSMELPAIELPITKEGESFEHEYVIGFNKSEDWALGTELKAAHCSLSANYRYAGFCPNQNYDDASSFCKVYRKQDGTTVQMKY